VSAGGAHSLALRADGTLWGWGRNEFGELGDNTTTDRHVPTPEFSNSTDWAAISSGMSFSLGLKHDGTLWTWGLNDKGQLGDGTIVNKHEPTREVTAASDWMVASAGSNHTLAIKQDGSLWAWGCNDHGELGLDPVTYPTIQTPTRIGAGTDWVAVSGGYHYSLALKSNGTLWAWGYNDGGQLGDNTVVESHVPKQVGSATDWVKFDAGYHHSLGIKTDGTLWAWGYNNEGQLGDGTVTARLTPTKIGSATEWKSVVAGDYHSVAVGDGLKVSTWGDNQYSHQLGDGTATDSSTPKQVFDLADTAAP